MSRTMRYTVSAMCAALVPAAILLSHPHFRKSITAKLPAGLEVKFEYTILPWNPAHLSEVKDGACGETQKDEICRHRRPPPHLSHAAGVDVPVIAGGSLFMNTTPWGFK